MAKKRKTPGGAKKALKKADRWQKLTSEGKKRNANWKNSTLYKMGKKKSPKK